MFKVNAVLFFGECWFSPLADISASSSPLHQSPSQADFLRTSLRCPSSWEPLLLDLKDADTLLSHGEAPQARQVLSRAVSRALEEDLELLEPVELRSRAFVRAASLRRALEECAVGMGTAFRLLAMSHYGDPKVRDAETKVQVAALEVALRMQHIASGWLIYAYNVAQHRDSFIDDSAWPIRSQEFGDEHRSVAATLRALRAQLPQSPSRSTEMVKPSIRVHGLSLCIVTICDYPDGVLLPRLAASVHGMYAHRHGYGYIHHRDSHHAKGPTTELNCHTGRCMLCCSSCLSVPSACQCALSCFRTSSCLGQGGSIAGGNGR